MGRKRNHRDLAEAQADEAPMRVGRTLDGAEELDGFVVALGDDWVVLHRLIDFRLAGWVALHLDTIREVSRVTHPTVIDRALEFWEQRPENPRLDPSSDVALLRSAAAAFPLVALHEEARFPDECAVGVPLRVGAKKVDLLDLDPAAEWGGAPRRFPLKHVTRIDVGDDYLTTLDHLAPAPPAALDLAIPH